MNELTKLVALYDHNSLLACCCFVHCCAVLIAYYFRMPIHHTFPTFTRAFAFSMFCCCVRFATLFWWIRAEEWMAERGKCQRRKAYGKQPKSKVHEENLHTHINIYTFIALTHTSICKHSAALKRLAWLFRHSRVCWHTYAYKSVNFTCLYVDVCMYVLLL